MGQQLVAHGVTAYIKRRCRCQRCRQAWNVYMRGYKRRAKPTSASGFYRGKADAGARVRLTPLGWQILERTVARTGQDASDVMEAALRCCASKVTFEQGNA